MTRPAILPTGTPVPGRAPAMADAPGVDTTGPAAPLRRRALRQLIGAAAGGLMGSIAGDAFGSGSDLAGSAEQLIAEGWSEVVPAGAEPPPQRRLRLVNAHTWEEVDVVYMTRGVFIDESLQTVSHLMRDHRAERSLPIDPVLIDHLYRLSESLDTDEPLHILSGYRTPETNATLRKRSRGVAKYSLHMEGRAADMYVPGVPTRTLQQAAIALQGGGVGFYGKSGFVHMDTGEQRYWGS